MIGGDGINDESNKTAPAPTRNTDLTKYTFASQRACTFIIQFAMSWRDIVAPHALRSASMR